MEGGTPRTDEEEEIEGEICYLDEEEMSHHTSGEKQTSAEEENNEEEEIEGEIQYSDEEEGIYHTCEEERDNHSSEREGTEPPENTNVSSPRIPLRKDQLAQILASMSEYVKLHSPLDLNVDIN